MRDVLERLSRLEKKVDKLYWALIAFLLGQIALQHTNVLSTLFALTK